MQIYTIRRDDEDLISKSLTDLLSEYLTEKDKTCKSTTLESYKHDICLFIELVDNQTSNKLTKADVNLYKSKIVKLPARRSKKAAYRDKSIKELLLMNIDEGEMLSPISLNNITTNVSTFLNWSIKNGYIRAGINDPLMGYTK